MSNLKKWAAPAGVFVAVSALGIGATLLAGNGRGATPATLHLAGAASARSADAATLADSGSGSYQLVGTLPSGRPDDAPAWTVAADVDAAALARLADALKVGTPVKDGTGWRADGLYVNADGSWWWSLCADRAVSSSDGVTAGCAVDTPVAVSGGGSAGSDPGSIEPDSSTPAATPSPAGPGAPMPAPAPVPSPIATPSADEVRAAARPLLVALGLNPDDARVEYTSAVIDPEVGGLPTVGLTTRVGVGSDGKPTDASGWLVSLDKGDSYPLISAQAAFDALPELPRMLGGTSLACPVGPDGKGCLEPEPIAITGAHLGLSLQRLVGSGQALVPAWLFEVRGSDFLIPGVAVDPKYLDDGTGTEPSTGTKPEPNPSDQPAPPPASTDPGTAARTAFSFDAVSVGKDANTVVVRYGDSSSCPHENVTHQVKESADAVYIHLEADVMRPGIACTEDYRAMDVVVKLQAPLGDRKVVDGPSGRTFPLT